MRGRADRIGQSAAHAEQLNRLQHARAACNLYIPTDDLAPDEVANRVEIFIATHTS